MPLLTKSPLAEVLAELNTKNNTTFTDADIQFALVDPSDSVNSSLLVTPATGSRYENQQTVNYHRRDIARWFTGITVRVDAAEASTYGDVIDLINQRYGLKFASNDFSDAVRATTINYNDQNQLSLQIQVDDEHSYGWVGTLTVLAADPGARLDMSISNTQMDGLKYADGGDGSKPSAAVRTYPNNYSAQRTALQAVATGSGTVGSDLANALVSLTPMQDGDAAFVASDITSGNTTYNGPTSGYENANTAYSNVLVVNCTSGNFYGNFMFHYNV